MATALPPVLGTEHVIVTRDRILFSLAFNGGDPASIWTSVALPQAADGWSEVAIDSVALPHFAAVTSSGRVTHGKCLAWACDDAGHWSFDILAMDAALSPVQVAFQLDSGGKGVVVYSNAPGHLVELHEAGAGAPWTSRTLTDCGVPIVGSQPAFLLDDQDRMRLVYFDGSGLRYIVAP
jgi:hypothetical protein